MQKLFICYHSDFRTEVDALAQQLRLRGIAVWLDHDGGFAAGDNIHTVARRVIGSKDESFGLLFYASPEALSRDFIRKIELHEAILRKEHDSEYVLTAILHGLTFTEFSEQSQRKLGEDLSLFHSYQAKLAGDGQGIDGLRALFAEVANSILRQRLKQFPGDHGSDVLLGINFCTREHLPPSPDDFLDIDASAVFGAGNGLDPWPELAKALVDVKRIVRESLGVRRVRIRGSKHISAAFLLGHIFPPSTVREILVQQGGDLWTTAAAPSAEAPLAMQIVDGSANSTALFIELTATDNDIRESVRGLMRQSNVRPHLSLRFEPKRGLTRGSVTGNDVAIAMALQIRASILHAQQKRQIDEVHIFAAIPQGLALLMGHYINALTPIQLYEYINGSYIPSTQLLPSR